MLRKLISLSIALSFVVVMITGMLSYFQPYARITATLHTAFGFLLALGIFFHMKNNFHAIRKYCQSALPFTTLLAACLLFAGAYFQLTPFDDMMDFGARLKANTSRKLSHLNYEVIELNTGNEVKLTIDLLRAEHYWHPQIAIWTEDTLGNYLQTLFVTKSTAKGLFFGGRNKENFKDFDKKKEASGNYRRVDALPVWSHKRGVRHADGMYAPSNTGPLADGITGATPVDNFHLSTSTDYTSKFLLKIEINVAFDDNEYYSAFDFPDDEIFHNGTGQLGQPSILFETLIDMTDTNNYYLMELAGHGHHSARTGLVYKDLSTLTTALQIVKRIVVGVG